MSVSQRWKDRKSHVNLTWRVFYCDTVHTHDDPREQKYHINGRLPLLMVRLYEESDDSKKAALVKIAKTLYIANYDIF